MVVFFGERIKVAVPMSRIYQVMQTGSNVIINYDAGEVTYLSDADSSVAPKVESFICSYETAEIANDVMRSFYMACESKKGAFYF